MVYPLIGIFSVLLIVIINYFVWDTLKWESSDFVGILVKVLLSFLSLFLTATIVLPITYYWYHLKNVIDSRINCFQRIGYDITRLFSWFFSVNGLFTILVGTVVAIVVVFIINYDKIKENGDMLQLTAITLTISLSALIPSFISRIIIKGQIDEIINDKLNKELEKFQTSLYHIRRDKGHSSRMSGVLLFELAKTEENNAKTEENNDKTEENNDKISHAISHAMWSIGWFSEAIIQYLLIQEQYDNAIKRSGECLVYLERCSDIIVLQKELNDIEIHTRDFQSIITMHSLIKYFRCERRLCDSMDDFLKENSKENSGEKSRENKPNLFDILKNVEEKFYDYLSEQEKNRDIILSKCYISGMTDDINESLKKEAEKIINSIIEKNENE